MQLLYFKDVCNIFSLYVNISLDYLKKVIVFFFHFCKFLKHKILRAGAPIFNCNILYRQ